MLICDDDPMTIRALEFQFKKEGFEILKALNGRDASTLLSKNDDIDIMITDVYMPYVNGMELITYARNTLHRIFPIVIVSRANLHDSIEAALGLGANAYAVKPLNLGELSAKVNKLLNVN